MCQQQRLRSDIHHSQTISYHKFGSSSLAALGSLLANEYVNFLGKTLKICWWNPDFGVVKIWRNPTGALVRFGTYLVSSPIIGGNHPQSITPKKALSEKLIALADQLLGHGPDEDCSLEKSAGEVGSNGPATFIHNRICIYAYNVCINDILYIYIYILYNYYIVTIKITFCNSSFSQDLKLSSLGELSVLSLSHTGLGFPFNLIKKNHHLMPQATARFQPTWSLGIIILFSLLEIRKMFEPTNQFYWLLLLTRLWVHQNSKATQDPSKIKQKSFTKR